MMTVTGATLVGDSRRISGMMTAVLLLASTQLLNILSLHHLLAVGDRGLLKSLTAAELLNDTGLFIFTLKFLEGAFDVVAFLNGNNNHNEFVLFKCFVFVVNI